jgi:hypothetical protein
MRFQSLFPLRFDTAFRKIGSDTWRAMSKFHRLSDDEILECLSAQSQTIRACHLDTKTSFLVITIPSDSIYRCADRFNELVGCLTRIALMPNVYKAAASDDVQIYLSFNGTPQTADLAQALARHLSSNGFDLNALVNHSTNMLFALPLQPGFCWLNKDLSVKLNRDEIALPAAMAMFLRDLETAAVDPSILLDIDAEESAPEPLVPELSDAEIEESSVAGLSCSDLFAEPIYQQDEAIVPSGVESDSVASSVPETGLDNTAAQEVISPLAQVVGRSQLGTQLMLFPDAPLQPVSEVPKVKPKRGRKARSSLPDEADQGALSQNKVFSFKSTANLTVLSLQREVNADK